VLGWGEMKIGGKAGGKAASARRRKAVLPKRRKAPISRRRNSINAGKKADAALLRRERDEAVEQQRATSEVLRAISNSSDAASILQTIAESVARLLNVTDAEIVMRIEGDQLKSVAKYGPSPSWPVGTTRPLGRDWVTGRAVIDRTAVHVPDLRLAKREFPQGAAFARQFGHRTTLGVPLLREGSAIGAILIRRMEVKPFTNGQIELVSSFASQAVIAIENARLFNETKEALEQQTATADILKVIASSPSDVQPVFEVIVERAVRLCGARMGRVYRYDGNVIQMVAGYGLSVPGLGKVQQVFPRPATDDTIAGQVIQSRQAYFVTDIEHDQSVPALSRQMIEALGTRSQVTVPMLRAGGEPIGAITVGWADPGAYQDQQVTLLKTFATQAVIAIENARLFNETKEALEQQTATAEILQAINSSPGDLAPVFDAILEKAHRLCGVAQGSLQLYDGSKFRAVAIRGLSEAFANRLREGVSVNPNAQPLLQGARFIQIPDLGEIDDPLSRAAFELAGIRTVLFIPLRKDGTLLGRISASRSGVKLFSEKEIGLLESFAAQAVIAMENARLLGELRRRTSDLTESLKQQTATSEVLHIISSSPGDLAPVFDKMLENATRVCDAEFGSMVLVEGNAFRNTAFFNAPPAFVEARSGQITQLHPRSTLAEAIRTRQVVQIEDLRNSPAYLERTPSTVQLADLGGARTIVVVPMLRENDVIGLITVYRQEVRPFSDKQIELLTNFARQAVIAIENARLLKELRQRTDDLSEALVYQTGSSNILKVIASSPTDVGPALQAIVESACGICDANDAVALMKDGDDLRISAHHGTIPVNFEGWRISRQWVTGRAVVDKVTLQVADLLGPEGDEFTESKEILRKEGYRTVLSVPLLREGEAIGVICLRRTEVQPFNDKQIELLKSFADQAVIAISNVRLFEQVQERTRELSKSLDDLRIAQDRLIQTEKLASLGQLTAGIAHEIKNPLNFVNNFSALSVELTDELKDVLNQANLAEKIRQEVGELTQMLTSNLEKVVQHGKRADSIVKNMLLHSREGSGERRSADINALVGESLNLAYHGARAEKPGFTITLKHDLDPNAGALDLYPQEITRALLNLISNGFYAAIRRKAEADDDTFEPVLSATTRDLGETVEIRIRDNGTGISPEVRAKMFNPFFTTKPTGEGTGLGLSMTHDIIVKQHGGSIDVDTKPGAFTEFIVTLPRDNGTVGSEKPE